MQAIPIPSSRAAAVQDIFNLAAEKLGFKFVATRCKFLMFLVCSLFQLDFGSMKCLQKTFDFSFSLSHSLVQRKVKRRKSALFSCPGA